ncbi:hypothetical protein LguiA_024201 [Lonicera macranthoides]
MAAAEARAGWQRIANRCLVHEDARGAPKLSRCPSSSSSKLESDSVPLDASKNSDRPVSSYKPHNPNSSNLDVLPDAKWGLHLQPNFGHFKNFSKEQQNALEAELGLLTAGSVDQTVKFVRENQLMEGHATQSYTRTDSVEAINGDNLQKKPMDKDTIRELWDAGDNSIELEPCNGIVSEHPQKLCSVLDPNWIGEENTEPWWRTADKDELASLVSHKSLEYFENCDLPRPHSKHFGEEISTLDDYMRETPASISVGRKQCVLSAVGCLPRGSDTPFSLGTPEADDKEILHESNNDLSKAELIEALCHSQTRAREAEKAAQHAYDEKDHILKLVFRQASHLFAYKQWLQMLQLETLCLQLKENYPLSTCFPDFLSPKAKKQRKGRRTAAKRRPVPPRYQVSNCAVAFAMGLGLAGAGLLLGWTMGWLFPSL